MEKKILIVIFILLTVILVNAQWTVVAPTLEAQEAINHAENMAKTAESITTLNSIYGAMDKTLEYLDKVNSVVNTAVEVREIVEQYEHCLNRVQTISKQLKNMPNLDVGVMASCMGQLAMTSSYAMTLMTRTTQLVSSNIFKMSDADRFAEIRAVMQKLNELSAQIEMVYYKAQSAVFQKEMSDTYIY